MPSAPRWQGHEGSVMLGLVGMAGEAVGRSASSGRPPAPARLTDAPGAAGSGRGKQRCCQEE